MTAEGFCATRCLADPLRSPLWCARITLTTLPPTTTTTSTTTTSTTSGTGSTATTPTTTTLSTTTTTTTMGSTCGGGVCSSCASNPDCGYCFVTLSNEGKRFLKKSTKWREQTFRTICTLSLSLFSLSRRIESIMQGSCVSRESSLWSLCPLLGQQITTRTNISYTRGFMIARKRARECQQRRTDDVVVVLLHTSCVMSDDDEPVKPCVTMVCCHHTSSINELPGVRRLARAWHALVLSVGSVRRPQVGVLRSTGKGKKGTRMIDCAVRERAVSFDNDDEA